MATLTELKRWRQLGFDEASAGKLPVLVASAQLAGEDAYSAYMQGRRCAIAARDRDLAELKAS